MGLSAGGPMRCVLGPSEHATMQPFTCGLACCTVAPASHAHRDAIIQNPATLKASFITSTLPVGLEFHDRAIIWHVWLLGKRTFGKVVAVGCQGPQALSEAHVLWRADRVLSMLTMTWRRSSTPSPSS